MSITISSLGVEVEDDDDDEEDVMMIMMFASSCCKNQFRNGTVSCRSILAKSRRFVACGEMKV